MYYKQRKEDLTEWMQVGLSKKNEDDADLEDPLEQQEQSVEEDDCISFHSCDSGGMILLPPHYSYTNWRFRKKQRMGFIWNKSP
jgi:hypothetical protein